MKTEARMWMALGLVVTLLVAIGLHVVFAPWVAAALFVLLATWLAIHTGRKHGMKAGIGRFLKDMLFGW